MTGLVEYAGLADANEYQEPQLVYSFGQKSILSPSPRRAKILKKENPRNDAAFMKCDA
jgi:hypothetical protein